MFLHVGADVVVSLKQMVAILDLRSIQGAEPTREFLSQAYGRKRVFDVASGDPKSLVLTDEGIYLSPISSLTLKKRAINLSNIVLTDLAI